MTPEKWQKIEEIFHSALKIEADKRTQFIKDESDDEEIIAEVIKLVSAHEQSKSFIQNPIADEALRVISEDDLSTAATKNFRPRTIGPYLLLEKLGRGAFGEVWLAEKQSSLVTAKFAIKFTNDDDIEVEDIRREAELWQKASGHPNILPLIEANIYNDQAVIVSEYVKDGSLEIWLKRNGGKSPSQEKTVEIMNGILDGLEHLHNRRIIHRDLKPANILMQEGKPRLTDFGVSKILKDEGNTTKNISGTVAYMSPEALEGKRNFQSDLWSAAVIFYQMLTGKMPFQTPDQVSLMLAIVTKEPFTLPPDVKDKWGEFFKIALNKNPDLRFQSASQMKQAIEYAWNNLSLEPVTRQHKNLTPETDENAQTKIFDSNRDVIKTDEVENRTDASDLKKTEVLPIKSTDSNINKSKNSKWRFVGIGIGILAVILTVGGYFVLTRNNANNNLANQNKTDSNTESSSFKKYKVMSAEEKGQFIVLASQRILQEIKQGEESEITEKGVGFIRNRLEGYLIRKSPENINSCNIGDSSSAILKRGSALANDIGIEFKKNHLSPLIGIYLAMIEGEFCPCLQAPTGNLGLFQFTETQSNEYGLRAVKGSSPSNPDGRCDVRLSSKAASIRMKKLIAEDFGDGKDRVSFAISGFNSNNLNLKENIEAAKKEGETSVSIWQLMENKEEMPNEFEKLNLKYFPAFLASAIIGENPQAFGVEMPPLSSFDNTSQANTDSTPKSTNQPLEKSDSERIQTNHFKKEITGDNRESKYAFEVSSGETVLKIKIKADVDNAGAYIYFKDKNDDEIIPFVLAQGTIVDGGTVQTVKINTDKSMTVIMEVKELQYGSRATYPGTLEIDFSGDFVRREK